MFDAPELDTLANLRYRPSVRELEKDADRFDAFVHAWREIVKKPATDEFSFHHIAGIHGFPGSHNCMHTQYFFPWHRAYLHKLELALNKIDPDVALPWWDFTTEASRAEGLPRSFRPVDQGGIDVLASTYMKFGDPNPIDRETHREIGSPQELPQQSLVDLAFEQKNYISFRDIYYPRIHNAMHSWLGGDALSPGWTAFDPAFWIFHCAHDRHWWLWQLDNPGADPPNPSRNMRGLDTTAEKVLDINQLGYEYATTEIAVTV